MQKEFEILGRKVGLNFPPLVIAELGINHGGDLNIAFEMVDAAARAGVEVLKHQTHVVEDEMSKAAKKVTPGNSNISIYEIIANCALSEDDEIALQKYIQEKGMIFISTPFSRAAANRLEKMNVPAYKIGSGECNNYPLLKHIASFGKPIILSTGMNTIESVRKAVLTIKKFNVPLALMHTTNLYPTPIHLVRLGAMQQLMEEFPELPIGLSDHTLSNLACLAAAAQGASLLERHFTDNMQRIGPDIVCSMDEIACQELIIGSAEIHKMLGGTKEPAKEEKITMDFAFATIVTTKMILAGEKFTKDNIWVKRPGTGEIRAEFYDLVLGQVCVNTLEPDEHVSIKDLNPPISEEQIKNFTN
jgi:sialic acid synthase SpsE